jgi:hypothetical protein
LNWNYDFDLYKGFFMERKGPEFARFWKLFFESTDFYDKFQQIVKNIEPFCYFLISYLVCNQIWLIFFYMIAILATSQETLLVMRSNTEPKFISELTIWHTCVKGTLRIVILKSSRCINWTNDHWRLSITAFRPIGLNGNRPMSGPT